MDKDSAVVATSDTMTAVVKEPQTETSQSEADKPEAMKPTQTPMPSQTQTPKSSASTKANTEAANGANLKCGKYEGPMSGVQCHAHSYRGSRFSTCPI